jgi:hypothetical protein
VTSNLSFSELSLKNDNLLPRKEGTTTEDLATSIPLLVEEFMGEGIIFFFFFNIHYRNIKLI